MVPEPEISNNLKKNIDQTKKEELNKDLLRNVKLSASVPDYKELQRALGLGKLSPSMSQSSVNIDCSCTGLGGYSASASSLRSSLPNSSFSHPSTPSSSVHKLQDSSSFKMPCPSYKHVSSFEVEGEVASIMGGGVRRRHPLPTAAEGVPAEDGRKGPINDGHNFDASWSYLHPETDGSTDRTCMNDGASTSTHQNQSSSKSIKEENINIEPNEDAHNVNV